MPLDPIQVTLSGGEQLEVMKRFRNLYADQLEEIEVKLITIKRAAAEYEFVKQYLGEQPEVKKLLERTAEIEGLEKQRNRLGALLERIDSVLPKQAPGADAPSTFQRF